MQQEGQGKAKGVQAGFMASLSIEEMFAQVFTYNKKSELMCIWDELVANVQVPNLCRLKSVCKSFR